MIKIIKKTKYILTLFLFLICLAYIIYLKIKLNHNQNNIEIDNAIVKKEEIKDNNSIENQDECTIDIKGAINNPGVYTTICNSTVSDVIDLAGGLTLSADTSVINLAKKVNNEMVIIVYTKEEVANSNIVNTVIKTIENECVCPNIINDGCINTEITDEIGSANSLININTASLEELQTLPGIGVSKARAIVTYRDKNNGFKSIEELLNVDGIGEKLYEEIKIYITT